MRRVKLNKEDIYKGYLVLVNRKNPIKQTVFSNTIKLVPFGDENKGIFLERQTATLLEKLFQSVRCASSVVPVSGYRNKAEQEKIYEDSLKENGKWFTEKYVALPDCSEHQTGFAIDLGENQPHIDFICPSFPYDGIFAEFRRKADEYGFIERYGLGKENLTGISHEPWHFRYVGYPHARIINMNGFCLEEYIQFLREYPFGKQHYQFADSERSFEIAFVRAEEEQMHIEIPMNGYYQISGNNVDGFIITIWRPHL